MTEQEFVQLKKPSQLIKVAIKDARKLDREMYHPDSGMYYEPFPKEPGNGIICYVCTAGAVIVGTLGETSPDSRVPYNYPPEVERRLSAIDSLRSGELFTALGYLWGDNHCNQRTKELKLKIAPPKRWHFQSWDEFNEHLDDMERYANDLEAEGY